MSGRAAVITDVHGNVPALDAALERIDQLDVGGVYCCGDLVGYGPRPNEICRTIEERGIPTIYSNYDYAIARDLDDCGCFYPTPKDREIGERSVAWTLEHTDERSKQFMLDLPFDSPCVPASRRSSSRAIWGASLTMIDRHYGHLARDGREHAIRLLDELNAPAVDVRGRPVDAAKRTRRRARQRNTALSRR